MKHLRWLFVIVIFTLLYVSSYAEVDSADREDVYDQWKACETDGDCGVAEIGCYHWEAVNKKYAHHMLNDYYSSHICLASSGPGPIPNVACVEKMCVTTSGEGPPEIAFRPTLKGGVFDVEPLRKDSGANVVEPKWGWTIDQEQDDPDRVPGNY